MREHWQITTFKKSPPCIWYFVYDEACMVETHLRNPLLRDKSNEEPKWSFAIANVVCSKGVNCLQYSSSKNEVSMIMGEESREKFICMLILSHF
jgi:hypothetical protein